LIRCWFQYLCIDAQKETLPTDAAMTAKAHESARETKRAVRSGGGLVEVPADGDMIQVGT